MACTHIVCDLMGEIWPVSTPMPPYNLTIFNFKTRCNKIKENKEACSAKRWWRLTLSYIYADKKNSVQQITSKSDGFVLIVIMLIEVTCMGSIFSPTWVRCATQDTDHHLIGTDHKIQRSIQTDHQKMHFFFLWLRWRWFHGSFHRGGLLKMPTSCSIQPYMHIYQNAPWYFFFFTTRWLYKKGLGSAGDHHLLNRAFFSSWVVLSCQ